jgi:hypothetical protein
MAVGTGGTLGAIAPPFPQKKGFETQLSNKYNKPYRYLIMIHCKSHLHCFFIALFGNRGGSRISGYRGSIEKVS